MRSNYLAISLVIDAPIQSVWDALADWVPPFVCDVVHTGAIIKGVGKFELHEINASQTRFDWSEEVIAPRPLFFLIFPGLYLGVRISLRRFARTFR